MASKSRGSIEEGTVTFSHETEKDVTFAAASFQNQNFPSPPVVKLISVGTDNSLIAADKNLLIADDGTFAPTYPTLGALGLFEANGLYTIKDRRYSATLTHSPPSANSANDGKLILIERFEGVTIPITSSTDITDDGLVQIYFLAKFFGFEADGNDEIFIYTVNKNTITISADSTPAQFASQGVGLDMKLFVSLPEVGNSDLSTPTQDNIEYRWREINSSDSVSTGLLELDPLFIKNLDGSSSGADFENSFYWFKLEFKSLPGSGDSNNRKLSDLGGIFFYNTSNAFGENLYLSSVHAFIWDSSIASPGESERGWTEGVNLHSTPKPIILTKEKNPSVGVTFTNVTTTGMKVQTTAPFTGTIRYLCSVNG